MRPTSCKRGPKPRVNGKDRGLEFVSVYHLDPLSVEQVPANMIGRLLNQGDLRKLQWLLMKLQRILLKKKPPAPISATLRAAWPSTDGH
jgi:hypothetical protein